MGLFDVNYETSLLGETQIIDNQGNILKRLSKSDGPGVIAADIELKSAPPQEMPPETFWIPNLNIETKLTWWQQNSAGRAIYKNAKKKGMF